MESFLIASQANTVAQVMDAIPLALPEIVLLTMTSIILIADLFISDKGRAATYMLAQATLVLLIGLTLVTFTSTTAYGFNDTFVRDAMGDALKIFVYIITFGVFMYSKPYLKARNIFRGEFYVLGLFGVLGMMVMISAHNFITIYLGLELLSLCMYAMVAMHRDSQIASESAMKYFILGAIASGMLLYGMSMIYGASGSLDFAAISAMAAEKQTNMVFIFGLVFLIVGIAFKLGAVPFHMWLPDVYQGSPTAVTSYIGTAPKLAAFAMIMRMLVEGLGDFHEQWQSILVILAVASLVVGNIIAIAQTNLKRMLAYSTISHVGFLLLGVLSGSEEGLEAAMFYTVLYATMALGAFGVIMLLSRMGFEADELCDLKGLNQRSPWFAFIMLIFMFSMAGVPPFAGFWAKIAVLRAVVESGMLWLAIVAVAASVIGAFYYLRVIKYMYFDTPQDTQPIEAGTDVKFFLSLNGLIILVVGLKPDLLLGLCASVIPA